MHAAVRNSRVVSSGRSEWHSVASRFKNLQVVTAAERWKYLCYLVHWIPLHYHRTSRPPGQW